VAAFAANGEVQFVGGCIDRAGRNADRARAQSRVDVQHRDRVDLRLVEHARRDHRLGATRPFFRRLKEQHHGAGHGRTPARQHARCAEQHRGVGVVPARVHLSGDLARARFTRLLDDRQRVHIGAQCRRLPRQRTANHPDDARRRHAAMLDPERIELALDQRRGAHLFEAELGVAVDVAT
jgi:hypothetical protein